MPRNREMNTGKGQTLVRIDSFQLERWMTKYEVRVKWDIAESGISPISTREILNLLPSQDRGQELDRLLDLRLGYNIREHLRSGNSRHHRGHRSEFPALQ